MSEIYLPLIDLARDAIRLHLEAIETGGEVGDVSLPASFPRRLPDELRRPAGVFVTLWARGRELRGCIGHVSPVHDTLVEEVASCAIASATEDPRFPPVALHELALLEVEISILETPEKIRGLESLDPGVYGVIVSSGYRRGVLLPEVDGVDTAEQQVEIAKAKGGIRPGEPVALERFRVLKIRLEE